MARAQLRPLTMTVPARTVIDPGPPIVYEPGKVPLQIPGCRFFDLFTLQQIEVRHFNNEAGKTFEKALGLYSQTIQGQPDPFDIDLFLINNLWDSPVSVTVWYIGE